MTRKALVGMLLLGALFVFGLATFYVENWQFYVGKGYRLTANFPVVHTLDEGDLVRMAGVSVGTVETLEINTEAATQTPVRAVLWIRDGVAVRADDAATIKLASIFGGSYVAIERGDQTAPELNDGDHFAKIELTPSVTEVIEQAKVTLTDIDIAFEDLTAIMADLREGKGTMGRLLQDERLAGELDQIFADVADAASGLKSASERLEKGEGLLGKLIMDERMAEDAEEFLADARELAENLRAISEDLSHGEGTFGKLLASDELYVKLNDAFGTIGDVAALFKEGEGVLPALLEDPAMAEDLKVLAEQASLAAANLREITEKMSKGESTIGRLLADDEAYRKLDASLTDLNEFTAALSEGTGTVGKLVMSDEAYKKLTQLVDSVQGIVDTYREQSPMISFAGAVFGAF